MIQPDECQSCNCTNGAYLCYFDCHKQPASCAEVGISEEVTLIKTETSEHDDGICLAETRNKLL